MTKTFLVIFINITSIFISKGPFPVPVIQEIVRVPDDDQCEQQSVMTAKEKRQKRQRQLVKRCQPVIRVLDPAGGADAAEVERELISPPVDPSYKSIHNADYKIGRLLTDPSNENLYSGVMLFPKGAEKPFRDSGEMSMFGFVMAGEMEVTIHKTVVVLPRGGSFIVPKNNQYRFRNIGPRETKILFVNERSA